MKNIVTKTLWVISQLVGAILLFFTARRWIFIIASLLPNRVKGVNNADNVFTPPVLLLVAIRNEKEALPALLVSLAALNYSQQCLKIVFIDDGSSDNSQALLKTWVAKAPNRQLICLKHSVGKAQALNEALKHFSFGQIVAIYDADERPTENALYHLVSPFINETVGAVSGRRAVNNALASPAASYTTFEGLVHQLITLKGKDRLNLPTAILGSNCAYRRLALTQVGYFKAGALLEDSDLTLKLAKAGWQIRFQAQAISYHAVPQTLTGYWRQHIRWARGFNEVARSHGYAILRDKRLTWLLRLELFTFSVGYLDRLALIVAVGLTLLKKWSHFPSWIIGLNLLTPAIQIGVALKASRANHKLWQRLIWLPAFFMVDIAMAAHGMLNSLKQSPQIWEERRERQ